MQVKKRSYFDMVGLDVPLIFEFGVEMDLDPTLRGGLELGLKICPVKTSTVEAREREWAEGTVSSLPGTLNVRIKFCHSTDIARSGGGVRAGTASYA